MSDEGLHMGDDKLRRYLRKVTGDLREAHRHIQETEQREREPIAIVGMSCRYPGGVSSPQELWELVASGTDAIGEFPGDRGWDVERLYDPDPDHPGTTYSRHGGFIYDAGKFDAGFFSIGPREALAMDPQQRLLLESAWETFEDAGIAPASLAGSATGVFAGVMHNNYGTGAGPVPAELEGHMATGAEDSVVSGRVAYTFGLEGPAVSVDTACSSSLVTIHLACQALRLGECELALAGGVTVFATPSAFVEFSRQRGLSLDGRCKSFGTGADGIGWAEGVGLLLLERLSVARSKGHRVLALVRGSAVNQDGASNGLTAPNGPSQERVIRQALASAGLSPAEVDAVEAHGTGTPLGDPIEAQALLATYGQERAGGEPLWLGALKSNIGHSAAASGVGGVIKMIQAMRHETLPPTLHSQQPSSHVDWSDGEVRLLSSPVSWPQGERTRRAAVSAFGVSGTNAHVILEEAPPAQEPQAKGAAQGGDAPASPQLDALPYLVSAADAAALSAQAARLGAFLRERPELELTGVAGALALDRARLSHRAVIVGEGRDALLAGLAALERGEAADGVFQDVAGSGGDGRIAFLFTGQGAQWAGMGAGLYEAFPVFAKALDEVCGGLDAHLGRPLQELLFAAEGSEEAVLLGRTQFTQAALFAVEVALYRLVSSFGVKPDFLLGHSIGELSAAFVAGVLSLEDACVLVAARGRLMGGLPDGGGMAAVMASEEEVLESLAGFRDRLTVAAVNGPVSVVVSGDEVALGEWEAAFGGERKMTRLRVSHAFHSQLMEPVLEEFKEIAQGLKFAEPTLPIVSNVTGEVLSAEDVVSPEYWARQIRGAVRFCDGVRTLEGVGVTRFLELGPDGVLSALAHECVSDEAAERALIVSSSRARRPQADAFLGFLAQAHAHGVRLDWEPLFDRADAARVALPTYAFQRERYWLEGVEGVTDASSLGQSSAEHPLLGSAMALAGEQEGWLFTGRISLKTHPWLADHAAMGQVLMPGTGFLELALAAGEKVGAGVVEELTLERPLLFAQEDAVQIQLSVSEPDEEEKRSIAVYSRPEALLEDEPDSEDQWARHASGVLAEVAQDASGDDVGQQAADELQRVADGPWPPAGAAAIDVELLYERLAEAGYNYGPTFQGLRRAWRVADDELYAEIALEAEPATEAVSFCIHPALSDAALHTALLGILDGTQSEVGVPFSFAGVRLLAQGANALRMCLRRDGDTLSVFALDEAGAPVLSIPTLKTRAIDQSQLQAAAPRSSHDALYGLEWVQLPPAAAADSRLQVAALGDARAIAAAGVELERCADLAALEQAVEQGAVAPELVVVEVRRLAELSQPIAADAQALADSDVGVAESVHLLSARVLELLQAWAASEQLAQAQLLLVTEDAVAVTEGEAPNLAQAALVGLVRSAQSEYPGRFGVLDLDGGELSEDALYGALASDEPELALRQGTLYAPRLSRLKLQDGNPPRPLDPQGTVLITGATGALGTLMAAHLAGRYEAKRLLLASRSGERAEGALALQAELRELGCDAQIVACDVSDRAQLQELIAAIPAEHPLTTVIHAAGVLADGLLESLDEERMRRVMTPKINTAINLHELAQDAELVFFSSSSAALGSPGQGNYAAANSFLDMLAHYRSAKGLPGMSLAWGTWDKAAGMTGGLSEADRARLERVGIVPLADEHGLEMFDVARGLDAPMLVPTYFDTAALRVQAKAAMLPAILQGLVRMPTRRAAEAKGSLARELANAPESEWDTIVSELVRGHVASVLGHSSPDAVDLQRAFKDLGFDSLGAVELRNRLGQASEIKLPSTLIFDYPTPAAVVGMLRAKVEGAGRGKAAAVRRPVRADEPVAIVGMSCRYPGGVSSPDELWELVAQGRDAIGEFPENRGWDVERLYNPDPDHLGTSYTRNGGFLYEAGNFDADFFSIGPREALAMDPQQRLLLEGAWEAFEDAGIPPATLLGSQTGVFAGVMYQDYGTNMGPVPPELEGYMGTGAGGSLISGRVSYTFGLEGPSVSVDTACSSALVAMHLASQALRAGECDMALAGGVAVVSTPGVFVVFSRQRGLAPDGRCKSFGAGADGVGWSEGVGLLVLERLSDAQRNGHQVLGLLRGSAVNQDGASNGLTAPNGPSQERVINQALASAGLSAGEVDVVEAHGTGTTLGDPIEAQALLATYGQERDGKPLWLGSLKSNIGHTQAAAGVGGVIKMVQAMRHGVLPKTLHAEEPSPFVDWSEGEVQLLSEQAPWERNGAPRRAGVSSFGVSGTNAHVIVEEAPPLQAQDAPRQDAPVDPSLACLPFLISAASEASLAGQAARLAAYLRTDPGVELNELAGALALDRARLPHRAVVVAEEPRALIDALAALEHGEQAGGLFRGAAGSEGGGKTAFLFSGQGSQWAGMGAELYETFPVFANALDEVCALLDEQLERPLRELLFAAEGSEEAALLDRTQYTQAALFALEVALYRLVSSFAVKPDFLMGHSIGELAAAHVAGVFSLADACALVAARGRLMGALPDGGAMAAVMASEAEVLESLAGFEQRLAVAAVNGPAAVVVSGEEAALGQWEGAFAEPARKITRLRVSHAFHSQLMDPMLDEFRALAQSTAFAAPTLPIVSNVTGEPAGDELLDPEYWVEHVRRAVRFCDGVQFLERAGVTRFLELGPDGVLSAMAYGCLGADTTDGGLLVSSLRGRRPEANELVGFLAQAHAHGVEVDWKTLFKQTHSGRVGLPTYAFQHRHYWLSATASAIDAISLGQSAAEHPLLGAAMGLAGEQEGWLFTGRVSLQSHPWLRDHAVLGRVLMPGTGFLELALAAGERVGANVLRELALERPLMLAERGATQIQLSVSEPDEDGRRSLAIYSRPQRAAQDELQAGQWIRNASGVLASDGQDALTTGESSPALASLAGAVWPPAGAEELDTEFLYDRLAEAGYNYGPTFQGLRSAWRVGDELYAEVALESEQASQAAAYGVHPALLDATLHAAFLAALQDGRASELEVPFAFSDVRLFGGGASVLRARLGGGADGPSLVALDESGAPVLAIGALETRAVDQSQLQAAESAGHDSLYELRWVELRGDDHDASPNGSRPSAALLGEGRELELAGAALERYPDLGALRDALEQGAEAPELVLVDAATMAARAEVGAVSDGVAVGAVSDVVVSASLQDESASDIHRAVERTLDLLQEWIAVQRLAESRLLLVTQGAAVLGDGETPSLAQAALAGLMRSAQAEHPGRFGLIDLDASEASKSALHGALVSEEPELALRDGALHVPRLALVDVPAGEQSAPEPLDPQSTVLITGGAGGLGALLARHLVVEHGARHLLLASRRGLEAQGARELEAELRELGCEDVRIVACDVSQRTQVQELLAAVSPEHPLSTAVHAAGVIDDGLIESLDGERLARVMAPKVDAAINLHESIGQAELILFSSAAATVGSPGQGNYAAANAFLDALACYRRALGLAGRSLAWGAWDQASGMTGELTEADRARLARVGIVALSRELGLELFDRARRVDRPRLVPLRLDASALRAQAQAGMLPAVLRGLVRMPTRRASGAKGSLAGKLAQTPKPEWDAVVLELVRSHVADVLGHTSGEAVDPQRAFKELGFDSLAAVELRNRLGEATGLKLPSTLVFDHPTPAAVASLLRSKVQGMGRGSAVAVRRQVSVDEPIAIVGMSCRYPGGVSSPADLWELVAREADAIGQFPEDRGWDLERLYNPDPDNPSTSYTRHGGFLYDAGNFDAEFFSIGPREALAMDPQQRLLLEASWEAFEDAGLDPAALRGSQTGVFTGVMYGDYGANVGPVPAELEGYLGTGSTGSVVSGRLAYMFGLEGPAMTVDTACSSSLVAMHLAAQALRSGECELALAGGVTVLSSPNVFVTFSRQRGLSVDGRCRSFGAEADGVGWAEGVGLLLLERLSVARENGHRVLGLVRGSAVNQDGASNGLTAPNGPSQERVIRQALASAGLSAGDVDVVEAHGTGTTLGDPIEAQALLATYGQERSGAPLWLGSVKSNIGHTQAAAGVAGVIKMVQAMRHETLPKTLHADEPSPHVDWSEGEVRLLTERTAWERNGAPRRAGVSSFGISGTNAHVILEEAPSVEVVAAEGERSHAKDVTAGAISSKLGVLPFLVSASSDGALRGQAARLGGFLDGEPGVELAGVAGALALDRARFAHRAVAVAEDRESLLASLGALERGEPAEGLFEGAALGGGKVAFLFTGQGAQWAGMGAGLYDAFPVFAEALNEVCGALDAHLGRPLKELLFAAEGSEEAVLLGRTQFTQAGLFAVEVALYRLVSSFGVKPDFLLGHSIGELSAAFVAGVLSLEDACVLVAARGRLMGGLPDGGGMAAVMASEGEVLESLAGFEQRLTVAAVNGPASVVVSGDEVALGEWEAVFGGERKVTRLRVSHAFHSRLMEPVLDEFKEIAGGLSFSESRLPIVSNVTGEVLSAEDVVSPEYWARQIRGAVRFCDGVRTLEGAGVTRFLELGPDGVLSALAEQCLEQLAGGSDGLEAGPSGAVLIACTARARRPEASGFLGFLARAHVDGVEVDWGVLFDGPREARVALPTYAFQRRHFWLQGSGGATDASSLGLGAGEHPLLSTALHLAGEQDGWLFTGRVSPRSHPWLRDHAVMGQVLMPGTGLLELALAAGERIGAGTVEELTLERPMLFAQEGAVQVQLSVSEPDEAGSRSISIYSRPQGAHDDEAQAEAWTRHATGSFAGGDGAARSAERDAPADGDSRAFASGAWPPQGAQELDVEFLYDRLAEVGYSYGPTFQGLRAAWRVGEELYAEVAVDSEQVDVTGFGVHPALLDAMLHTAFLGALDDGRSEIEVPFAFSGVRLLGRGASRLRVRLGGGGDAKALSLLALDEGGAPALSVQAVRTRAIDRSQLQAARPSNDALYELGWVGQESVSRNNGSPPRTAVLGEGLGLELAGVELERYGDLRALQGAIEAGAEPPELVLVDARAIAGGFDGELAQSVYGVTARVLELLQEWIAAEPLPEARLLLVTERAVFAVDGQAPDLRQAALVGLLRSAQSEHPGRFGLVDLDGSEASAGALPGVLVSEEPELALRAGSPYAPRLGRVAAPRDTPAPEPLDSRRTVLITGGTGGLGAILARHLVVEHGVERLLLVSRSGERAAGAKELVAELRELGCGDVRVAACDVSQREQLRELLDSVAGEHRLGVVVHAAGVLDDGVLESLDGERLARVMGPKVAAAVNLHELAGQDGQAELILFSSAAATVGSPGQANYAAANAFLDALAAHRHALGLPGMSMAWGAWDQASGMTETLSDGDRARFERLGISPLSAEQGLELFDLARAIDAPQLVPMRLDASGLRAQAKAGMLPAVLRGLIRMPTRAAADAQGSLAARLADVPEAEWDGIVAELVRSQVAGVLGHASAEAVDPQRAFKELGFDSLAAVELRNRLSQTTGLKLPSTLVFDHPTPAAVAKLLSSKVPRTGAARPAIDDGLDRLEALLSSIAADGDEQARVKARLQAMTRRVEAALLDDALAAEQDDVDGALDSATDDELFELIDKRRDGDHDADEAGLR
jgi:acyl transferase domain-containing protein/acyl carrier protein